MSVIQCALDVIANDKKVDKWSAYKKELILRMSPRVLPTLIGGDKDNPIVIEGVNITIRK